MSRHRQEPPRRHQATRAADLRPRYGRIAAAGLSLLITLVALAGGIGLVPVDGPPTAAYAGSASRSGSAEVARETAATSAASPARGAAPGSAPASAPGSTASSASASSATARSASTALPAGSGSGRRVVFDMSDQRVWLVDRSGSVVSTYLVSGSLTDNLHPGSYAVYSRSRWAVGVDDSGVMQYFVRFTRGDNAAIGFHSIPTKHGLPLQTEAMLGTPRSHGCIRQRLSDARRLWSFAPDGTPVVVTA